MSTLSTKNGCNSKGHPITKNKPLRETHQRQHPNHECQAFKRRPLRRKHGVQFHSLPFPSQQCNPSNIRSPSSSASPSASCCCCSSISHHPRHQYNTKIHRQQQSTSTPANTNKLSAATTTPRKSPILTLLLSLAVLLISTPISTTLASSNTEINRCPLRPPSSISRAPLILGHRGASFHLPEHSMPSYRLALELGADYIEPDLVPSSDGVLVAIHHIDLNFTTNIHTHNNGQFQSRARQSPANNNEWGYYVHDFTWEELQLLRVRQRVFDSGARSDAFDYVFGIPSFTEIVTLLHDWNTRELPLIGRTSLSMTKKTGGVPGLYVELKRSQFFKDDANVLLPELFLDELANHPKASELLFDHVTLCDGLRYDEYRVPPLVVSSFEGEVLEYLRQRFRERWMDFVEEDALLLSSSSSSSSSSVGDNGNTDGSSSSQNDDDADHPWIPPLVLLVDSTYCRNTEFWFDIEKLHISGIGPDKECLLPSSSEIASNNTSAIERSKRLASEWVTKAHSIHGLAVHPWTVRLEMESYGQTGGVPGIFSSAEEEMQYYFCDLKVDGIFTENIALASIVGTEGCASSDEETSTTSKTTNDWPQIGKGGPVCVEEERSLWFFGLSFGAVGAFLGSIITYFFSLSLRSTNRGYCLGRNATEMTSVDVDTASAEEEHIDDGTQML